LIIKEKREAWGAGLGDDEDDDGKALHVYVKLEDDKDCSPLGDAAGGYFEVDEVRQSE
jgi:hypothetical protein